MGRYLNPGNGGFERILKSKYIDKTGLIGQINERMETPDGLVCISRPRRFGKSYAAQMLSAYYDCSCDSHNLFHDLEVSKFDSYEVYINKYNVICLDIAGFLSRMRSEGRPIGNITTFIIDELRNEIASAYPDLITEKMSLSDCFRRMAEGTDHKPGKKIVFIIDEWDVVIREAGDQPDVQEIYLNLLRGWFKDITFTPIVVAAAYMTGILPIKKDGSQSAISDFKEFSMLDPDVFAPYFGFTEGEVKNICHEAGMDFKTTKYWYDGYTVGALHSIYNPYSVISAAKAKDHRYRSYWKKTSAAETLMTYIDMNQDGLQETVAKLMARETVEVDTELFQNDVETFESKDDVLTLLIHLGYLTFDLEEEPYGGESLAGLVRIPNEEVRREFGAILRRAKHKKLIELVRKSDRLLQDIINGRNEEAAEAIQDVHDSCYAPTYYNDEQSLRSVIRLACISWDDQYAKAEELPSGHGIADVAFFPKRRSALPAIVIELKWNKSGNGAIQQMKNRNYQKVFEQFDGEIILAGVNYDSVSKKHTCRIERVRK